MIAMFNNYEFDGGRLEVREDRFYHINAARGAHGGPRGGRGGSRGGFSGGHSSFAASGGNSRTTDNLYGDYTGPDGTPTAPEAAAGDVEMGNGYSGSGIGGGRGGGGRGGFAGGRGGYPTGPGGFSERSKTFEPRQAAPSTQIFVQNVRISQNGDLGRYRLKLATQLPWSTANEDLVELFQTTGTVQEAEVLWEAGRSKGSGVVQFGTIEEAETAIGMFFTLAYTF